MRICFLFLAISLLSGPSFTQTDDRHTVDQLITDLFDGMRTADTARVAALLHPDITMHSVHYDQAGTPTLSSGSAQEWLTVIATYPSGTLDERLYSRVIELDPPLATAWTEYSFFLNGRLSHCGTNAFQLIQTPEDGWQVLNVTDTRRRSDCTTEPQSLADSVHAFVDAWHHAAAVADEDTFFGSMADDGIYLGTDPSERWPRDTFRVWAQFAFERDTAWAFTPYDRQLYFTDNQTYVWWEEMLETWMGPCRGSGVAQWQDGVWRIKHYNLAVTIANDKIKGFIELTKE